MDGSSSQHFQNQHRVLRFGTINFIDHQGLEVSGSKNAEVLSQEVQNLTLKDSINGNENVARGSMVSEQSYPARPEVDNCFYFMQYGWCKFGSNCRYNHPFNQLIEANKELMMPGEENLTMMEHVECKYYLNPEGCKNEAGRYDHSGRKSVVAPVLEFNLLGLPIRPGQTECPYYMRNGSCKYGRSCLFDHSGPLSMGGGSPLVGYTGLENTMPCWSLAGPGPVNEICPYDPYMYPPFDPYMYPAEEISPYSEWSVHQVPEEHNKEWSQSTPSAFSMKTAAASAKPFQPNQRGKLITKGSSKPVVQPERNLKFGIEFYHPKTSLCNLNDRGLPLRSDTEVCYFYGRYGACKEGPACRFNHPATLRKAVPHARSEEAKVPVAGSQEAQVPPAGFQESQIPAAGSQEALPAQLPDPTTQDIAAL